MHLPSSTYVARTPVHLILLDFITKKTCCELYKLTQISSSCSLHQSSVTSSLLGLKIFLSTSFSNTFSMCERDRMFHTFIKQQKKIISFILFSPCIMKHYNSGYTNKYEILQSIYSFCYLAATCSGIVTVLRKLAPRFH